MSRGEVVFFFFGTEGKQRGLVWGIKRRNLGQDVGYIFHHCLGFRGGRGGESCVSVSEKWESQKGYKEVKRSDLLRVSTSFLSSLFCPLLLFVVFQSKHLQPRAKIQLNKKMTTAFGLTHACK